MVKLGDKEVEYNDKFKLILHTKLANPHYPPEVQAECTLINFMVTEDGLEDQLLAKVVTKERPDLEEEKTVLIQQQNEFTVKLKQLEDDLLRKLAEAQGDITEDVELIESLEDAKRTSTEIQEKVVIAKETEIVINQVCMCVRASVRVRVRGCVGACVRASHPYLHQPGPRGLPRRRQSFCAPLLRAGRALQSTQLLSLLPRRLHGRFPQVH